MWNLCLKYIHFLWWLVKDSYCSSLGLVVLIGSSIVDLLQSKFLIFLGMTQGEYEFQMKSNIHKHPEGFQCGFCGRVLRFMNNTRRHIREKHLEAPLRFVCPMCHKSFAAKRLLGRHINQCHLGFMATNVKIPKSSAKEDVGEDDEEETEIKSDPDFVPWLHIL